MYLFLWREAVTRRHVYSPTFWRFLRSSVLNNGFISVAILEVLSWFRIQSKIINCMCIWVYRSVRDCCETEESGILEGCRCPHVRHYHRLTAKKNIIHSGLRFDDLRDRVACITVFIVSPFLRQPGSNHGHVNVEKCNFYFYITIYYYTYSAYFSLYKF